MQNQHSYVILRSGATKNPCLCPNSPDLGQRDLRSPFHLFRLRLMINDLHTHSMLNYIINFGKGNKSIPSINKML